MFVPRQVQKSYTAGHPTALPKSKASKSPTLNPTTTTTTTVTAIDIGTAKAIVLVLEQLFSSENPHTEWLEQRMREVDGHDDYVHLAAVIECPYLSQHKPTLSQVVVRRALEAAPSEILQKSADGYHLRLTSSVKRSALLESHTVYIEPSISNATRAPGRLALELQNTLPKILLPVRYTTNTARSWALLTLSSGVTEEHTNNPSLWPSGWIVLPQQEWKRRDALYRERRKQALVSRRNLPEKEEGHHGREREEQAVPAAAPQKHTFEPGLIVHIMNLHTGVNKPSISSFIMRSVDRYLRKREKRKAAKSGEDEGEALHKVQINYIDYKKGRDSCYIRQAAREDSELIIAALKKRQRAMTEGDDRKGRKVKEGFVVGRLLEGEEETLYWQTVQSSENAKKGKKKGKGGGSGGIVPPAMPTLTVNVRHGSKRPRLGSASLSSPPPGDTKRKRH
ncbi:hypothetical protein FN846DRAFT_906074 [Sphaerosporella brunnea]|uniref:XRRM domain-containing protein n=1 Tax=Sphaerosporella brunnea TaxID=1250544 RepID=A0A5J5EZM7_9PEZI|nr:hypothetical protein FN846DRAFT_906074 [Sphaerosporella brunnea]